MNKNYEILVFHKILDMLANLSANEITREKVKSIVPTSDLADARAEMEKHILRSMDDALTYYL